VTTLVLILGDQLTPGIASLRGLDRAETVVMMAEVQAEATYVRHHKQKIALVFAAMRHFAEALRRDGWTVDYVTLDAPGNTGGFTGEVARAVARHGATRLRVVEAGEWRVQSMLDRWAARASIAVEVLPDDRFLCSRDEFAAWAEGRNRLVMEDFYRAMRRRTGLLMDGGRPAGGRWNYDAENRKRPPAGLNYPAPPDAAPDAITEDVLALVETRFAGHFGELRPFRWAVTREQALAELDHFVANALPRFGDYQDAMVDGQDRLYHSALSAYLNLGLLRPLEVAQAADVAWRRGEAPLNAAEGFIRQIIGWREYVRGLYFLEGPAYAHANALGATRPLPDFYWTGETDLRCLHQAIDQTRRTAYAHHIQRLMLLGNFAMLAGVAPDQVSDWFLVVYADAFEWVELPNVIGMSQFADGGRLGTKPYAAGGAYVARMSDHCARCRYDVKAKTGPDACPLNYLYWDFLDRNRGALGDNPRLLPVYRNWDRLGEERQAAVRASAETFLSALKPAAPGWARAVSAASAAGAPPAA
jgi:deoxyribodipyrimidine photolyase-related protein